jgi:exodeoxyribonuclease VII large subunit
MQRDEPVKVYRVAELSRRLRLKMEGWGEVWVEGELSDVQRASSGHVYFTLHDGLEQAQLRGVMFRGDARFARARMEQGERVRVLGTLSLFEPRGTFQILARVALTAGDGDRRAELEKLKKKLAAEGLFALERKRALPRYPRVVGLVTSKEGAALHDVVRVASARAPVRLVVSHCQVQGAEAPLSIVRALKRVAKVPGLDVVIVTRGGGAAEDLGAFNDERVARAIAACPVPVVSGVGHEVDETIADLVADVRAATPSNAAEQVVPDGKALARELELWRRRLERGLEVHVGRGRLRLERLERRVADPRRALAGVRHRFVAAQADLERAMGQVTAKARHRLQALAQRLGRHDPRAALARDRAALVGLAHRLRSIRRPLIEDRRRELGELEAAVRANIGPPVGARRSRLAELAARLGALSPLSILARGYAIAIHVPSGRALLSAGDAAVGDELEVRLSEGRLLAEVKRVDGGA